MPPVYAAEMFHLSYVATMWMEFKKSALCCPELLSVASYDWCFCQLAHNIAKITGNFKHVDKARSPLNLAILLGKLVKMPVIIVATLGLLW